MISTDQKTEIIELIRSTYFFIGKESGTQLNENSLFGKIPVNRCKWPVRFVHALTTCKQIVFLKDLLNTDYEEFFKLSNCGKKTIHDARQTVIFFVNNNFNVLLDDRSAGGVVLEVPESKEKEIVTEEKFHGSIQNSEVNSTFNFVTAIEDLFSEINKRDLEIALQRWSYGKLIHYAEIGKKYNITRERVRQILYQIIKNLKTKYRYYLNEWGQLLLDRLVQQPKPINKDILTEYNLKYSPYLYLGLFSEVFEEVPFDKFMPKSFEQLNKRKIISNPKWAKIVETLNNIPPMLGQITPSNIVSILSSKGFSLSDQLLCFKIILGLKKYFFFEEGTNYFLLRRGGIRDISYTILNSSEIPLSIDEILSEMRKYYYDGPKYDSLGSVIGNIKQDEKIIQFDRYKFGIERHFSYSRDEWLLICSIAKIFLSEIKRQSYITEILEKVCTDFPLIKSKYELVYILRTDPEIKDLGFFNFTLTSFNQEERIKVTELIKEIFNKEPSIKHFHEISEKLKENRYIRDEGIGTLLSNQDFLEKYPGGFYGLKELAAYNRIALSKREKFICYLVSQYFFPNTEVNRVLNYFDSEELKQNASDVIYSSNTLYIYSSDMNIDIILNNNWSVIKKVKCLLFNIDEPIFEEQLNWMLKDLGITAEKNDFYKIRNETTINYSNHKYSFIKTELPPIELITVLDDCYNFINDSASSFNLNEMYELVKNYVYDEINFSQFMVAVKEDERFIVTDNNLVLIK